MNDKSFKKELKSWMRYTKKESDKKKDGLSYDVFGAPNLPSFISKPVIRSFLNSKKQNKADIQKIKSSSHFILITTTDNTINNWILTGRYLQQFLLKLTDYCIAHAYMNQPCELEILSTKLKENLPINNENPQILLRIGYAKEAPFSRRKDIEEVMDKIPHSEHISTE